MLQPIMCVFPCRICVVLVPFQLGSLAVCGAVLNEQREKYICAFFVYVHYSRARVAFSEVDFLEAFLVLRAPGAFPLVFPSASGACFEILVLE